MRIDLGKKMDDCTPCCAPSPAKDSEPKVYYPSLYMSGSPDLAEIPESGVIELRFRRVSKSIRDRDGKQQIEVEIEALEVLDVESDEDEAKETAEESFDKTARKVLGDGEGDDKY